MRELEEKLGYEFKNKELLTHALTHSSYANENRGKGIYSNERLEYLGDAVLELISARYIYDLKPAMPEGKMTRLRSELVCEQSLYAVAKDLSLGKYLLMGKGEDKNGGRERQSILADATEAVLAAMYLDGGFEVADAFVRRMLLNPESIKEKGTEDYKTELQELVQRSPNSHISYELIDEYGPDHEKTFVFKVSLNGDQIGEGKGHTKKEAEQASAREALKKLKNDT